MNSGQSVGFNLQLKDATLQTHVNDIHLTTEFKNKQKLRIQNSYQLQDIIYKEDVQYYNITTTTTGKHAGLEASRWQPHY